MINNEMLKSAKHFITPSLERIFNSILDSGIFPDMWTKSIIKPLFKGGSKYNTSDYRGISLSSCLGKLFCSIINARIVEYLEEKKSE